MLRSGHAGGVDLRDHGLGQGHHALAAGPAVLHLGLDVEADLLGVGVAHQLEDVLELGDPVALDHVLLRVPLQLGETAVQGLDLRERQLGHPVADVRDTRASPGVAGAVSRHLSAWMVSSCQTMTLPSVVRWVSSSSVVTPELQRVGERGQRFLGPLAAASAVGLQVEGAVALVGLDAGCCLYGAVPAAFDDGAEPASGFEAATAGLASEAMSAAAAAAVRGVRMVMVPPG